LDFLWSSCALDHLGSLEHGKKLVLDAMQCLKPSGVALHGTESCLSSDDATLEAEDLVFYREKDILDLWRSEGVRLDLCVFLPGLVLSCQKREPQRDSFPWASANR
jgi:hypothetical protein